MSLLPDEPNVARMYDYWLDEKDRSTAYRAAASGITEQFPEVATTAWANRACLAAVSFA